MTASIILVAGARPNFMKIAPVLRALDARFGPEARRLVHTGQHYDAALSQVFFDELGIPAPDVHLDVGSGTHGAQTARVLAAFEELLLKASPQPRGVVVVGDVNSTMAAALAAVKLGIPVAHVEAGLRSFDRTMPEEINRLVTDAIADLLLCSEPSGVENLAREGIPAERVHLVGNVMIDTLARELEAARGLDTAGAMGLRRGELALVTLHRPSNVDGKDRLEALLGFLERIAARLPVVFPAHPRTRARLEAFGLSARVGAIRGLHLSEPLPYRANLSLMANARLVITDSGGIQEETSFLGVPCLTLRPSTERPVTVTLGTNTIVGEDLGRAETLVDDILAGRYKTGAPIPLWDGHAAERVADVLARAWHRGEGSVVTKDRVSANPEICHGQACVCGTRIPVHQVARMLANGDTVEDLLAEYPALHRDDILACAHGTRPGVVATSWGAIPLPAEGVKQVLAEEDDLVDT